MTNRAERVAGELEATLVSFTGQNRLPGAAAGVVCGDELAWLGGTGFAEVATGKATDPAMLYGIASITKTFTGTAIMQLRDAGRRRPRRRRPRPVPVKRVASWGHPLRPSHHRGPF